jgi:hypothetical protein
MRKALLETAPSQRVVEMGLRVLLERGARKRLRDLFGSGPKVDEIRRRRSCRWIRFAGRGRIQIFGSRYTAPKRYRDGTHRAAVPAATLARARPLMNRWGSPGWRT